MEVDHDQVRHIITGSAGTLYRLLLGKGSLMNDINYAEIVRKLIKLREKHHISRADMADYVGISRQSIYNFEMGHRTSYRLILSYITHPSFTSEEREDIYNLMGG